MALRFIPGPMAAPRPSPEPRARSPKAPSRVPALIRWPGHVKPGSVSHGIISGLDWFPTPVCAAGNPNINEQLLKGVDLSGQK